MNIYLVDDFETYYKPKDFEKLWSKREAIYTHTDDQYLIEMAEKGHHILSSVVDRMPPAKSNNKKRLTLKLKRCYNATIFRW